MRWTSFLFAVVFALPALAADKPNVILIITDDQGYGDIAAHGNPVIKTPNMDKLHSESVRFTDYHVDPTCSPTRSALLTGRYSTRVGVWHTINGRSMLPGDELTIAEVFKANGYSTGMFGKWHLGDCFPCRPQDQGFDHVVWHKGGGIGQGPDYFGNDYFDDTYDVNGKWQKFEGYCTDVWFREATKFINEKKGGDEPFFIYLATNAPHGPYLVDEKYSKPYEEAGVPSPGNKFYGMIENIDENLGKLREYLEENDLSENTLLIFTTDNGSALGESSRKSGFKGFNANMRGHKGSQYDGGHRVPLFMHWPGANMDNAKSIDNLCAHVDVLPTLVDLLKFEKPAGKQLDGSSLVPAMLGAEGDIDGRTIFAHRQREYIPPKWTASVAMNGDWRFVDGERLYNLGSDPGQQNDVAADNPEIVAKLKADYEAWWKSLEPEFSKTVRYGLGGDENPTVLMSHDWLMTKGNAAWHQNYVRSNQINDGSFAVNVVKAGKYHITPMRWADYVNQPSGCVYSEVALLDRSGKSFGGERDLEPSESAEPIEVDLPEGNLSLRATLTRKDGKKFGAYYVKVELIAADE